MQPALLQDGASARDDVVFTVAIFESQKIDILIQHRIPVCHHPEQSTQWARQQTSHCEALHNISTLPMLSLVQNLVFAGFTIIVSLTPIVQSLVFS